MRVEITDPYGFIYITTNMINGKKYIGQKMFDNYGSGRWKTYLGSGSHFKRALSKYGKENFNREIIAITYSVEESNKLELEFIKNHNAVENKSYYNSSHGGNLIMKNIHHSRETRARMKVSHTGTKESEETRRKIGLAHKGKILSEETRNRISESRGDKYSSENHPHYGKQNSAETRSKISESNKGRKSWNEGLHYTDESKQKMSDSGRSKLTDKQLEEIREKYSMGTSSSALGKEYHVCYATILNITGYKHAYAKTSYGARSKISITQ